MEHVVILGAGFGGLELATILSEELAGEVRTTLVDRNDSFVFGFSKLEVMFGKRRPGDVRVHYRDMAKPGVEFRQETIESIDPVARRVVTDGGTYDADVLVVALGADLDPGATPGLAEGGHEFYSMPGAEAVREVLPTFTSGVAVIAMLGRFFKCPPAPFEAAFLLHDSLVARRVREAVTIKVLSPLPAPIPVSPEASAAILAGLEERGMEFWPRSQVTSLDATDRTAFLEDGQAVDYDLFLAVPVHRAPAVVEASALAEDGWIPVDPATFTTRFPDVYAVGDVTSAPVPRAGVFAEGQAQTVARGIVSRLRDGAPPPPYRGAAACYLEFGRSGVARVDVDFLGGPSPTGTFNPPSPALAAERESFGPVRRQRWFGQAL